MCFECVRLCASSHLCCAVADHAAKSKDLLHCVVMIHNGVKMNSGDHNFSNSDLNAFLTFRTGERNVVSLMFQCYASKHLSRWSRHIWYLDPKTVDV